MAALLPMDEDAFKKSLEYAANKLNIPSNFKPQQVQAIKNILEGRDLFVNLPTGYGKSLIYQAAPLCSYFIRREAEPSPAPENGSSTAAAAAATTTSMTAVVISPLVSLMKEQTDILRGLGIPVLYMGEAHNEQLDDPVIVFMSPETAMSKGRTWIESHSQSLCGLFVDESHCVVKWGQDSKKVAAFRESYGMLAELRSVVHTSVPMVALTATSSLAVREGIIQSLALVSPVFIVESPDRPNIHYSVIYSTLKEHPDIFRGLMSELKKCQGQTPKTVVFCRTHRQCRQLYAAFGSFIGDSSPRRYAMYHSTTEESVKNTVLQSFGKADGDIRVLFCTIAFGMGVNCQNLTRIYHFGPSNGIDDYVQESGRGGRSGEPSYAVLVHYKGCTRHKVSKDMEQYMSNKEDCRRVHLLRPFGVEPTTSKVPHTCCDVCARACLCGGTQCRDPMYGSVTLNVDLKKGVPDVKTKCRNVTAEMRQELSYHLLKFRADLLKEKVEGASLYAGEDLTSAVPRAAVMNIVRDCEHIHSIDTLKTGYGLFNHYAEVWDILVSTVGTCQGCEPVTLSSASHPSVLESSSSDSDSDDSISDNFRGVLLFSSESD